MDKIVGFKKINQDAIIPNYAHEKDAGMDLYSVVDYMLQPGEHKVISTGLSVEIPNGYEMQVRPKSGIAAKYAVTVLNTPGTVDAPYRGEVGVIMINHSKVPYEIKKGEKIAQAVFNQIAYAKIELVDELSDTSRGEGGFGSTGKR